MDDDGAQQAQVLATFLDVTGADDAMATSILEATNWQLEDAVQLFYAGGIQEPAPQPANPAPAINPAADLGAQAGLQGGDDYVRPPLPVRREALYDDDYHGYRGMAHAMGPASAPLVDAFRNFHEEAMQRAAAGRREPRDEDEEEDNDDRAAEPGSAFGPATAGGRNLGALYAAPVDVMFKGTFQMAKDEAVRKGKWLLVNLQSRTEFASHMLNRDTWAHAAVKEALTGYFIFFQVYNDTEEGRKVSTYYKLETAPFILVVDPQTGAKQRSWEGMVEPERLLEDLVQYMDRGPLEKRPPNKRARDNLRPSTGEAAAGPSAASVAANGLAAESAAAAAAPREETEEEMLQRALAASLEEQPEAGKASGAEGASSEAIGPSAEPEPEPVPKPVSWPELPPEPDSTSACRVAVRFPDGRRGQRRFLPADSVKLLGSFCCHEVPEAARRPFRLAQGMGGGQVALDSDMSIADAKVANSMLAMTWI